jgi:hypothetical protein
LHSQSTKQVQRLSASCSAEAEAGTTRDNHDDEDGDDCSDAASVVMVMMKKNEKREPIIETRDQKLSLFIIRESLKEGFHRMEETRFRFAIKVMLTAENAGREKEETAFAEHKTAAADVEGASLCRSEREKVMEITCLSHDGSKKTGSFNPLPRKDSLKGSANGSQKGQEITLTESPSLFLPDSLVKCSLHQQSGCKSRSISYSAQSDFHSGK